MDPIQKLSVWLGRFHPRRDFSNGHWVTIMPNNQRYQHLRDLFGRFIHYQPTEEFVVTSTPSEEHILLHAILAQEEHNDCDRWNAEWMARICKWIKRVFAARLEFHPDKHMDKSKEVQDKATEWFAAGQRISDLMEECIAEWKKITNQYQPPEFAPGPLLGEYATPHSYFTYPTPPNPTHTFSGSSFEYATSHPNPTHSEPPRSPPCTTSSRSDPVFEYATTNESPMDMEIGEGKEEKAIPDSPKSGEHKVDEFENWLISKGHKKKEVDRHINILEMILKNGRTIEEAITQESTCDTYGTLVKLKTWLRHRVLFPTETKPTKSKDGSRNMKSKGRRQKLCKIIVDEKLTSIVCQNCGEEKPPNQFPTVDRKVHAIMERYDECRKCRDKRRKEAKEINKID